MAEEEQLENWVRVQKKAFTRWCNIHLQEREKKVKDLKYDFSDGVLLCDLMEIISGKHLPTKCHPRPRVKLQRVSNIGIALDFIKKEGIPLVNCSAEDIEQGSLKLVLKIFSKIMGLIWILILRYQIQKYLSPGSIDKIKEESISINNASNNNHNNNSNNNSPKGEVEEPNQITPPKNRSSSLSTYHIVSPSNPLLQWSQRQLESYSEIKLDNFTSCWKDGKAFLALTQKACPDAFSYEIELQEDDPIANMKKAFEIAERELGIPSDLLDPEDIISSNPPDEKSIMTYVSLLVPHIEKKAKPKSKKSNKKDAETQTEINKKTISTQTETLSDLNPSWIQFNDKVSLLEEDLQSLWTSATFVLPESERPDSSSFPSFKQDSPNSSDSTFLEKKFIHFHQQTNAIMSLMENIKKQTASHKLLQEIQLQYQVSQSSLNELQSQFKSLHEKHEQELNEKNSQIQKLTDKLNEEIKQSALQKSSLEEERNQLSTLVETFKLQLSELNETQKKDHQEYQKQINSLQTKLKNSKEELAQSKEMCETKLSEIKNLNDQVSFLQEESKEKQNLSNQRISSIQTELENTLNQLKDSQGTSTQLQSQVNLLQAELNTLKQEKSKMEEEEKEKLQIITKQMQDLESASLTLKKKEDELKEVQTKNQNLEGKITKYEKEIKEKEETIKNFEMKIDNLIEEEKVKQKQYEQKIASLEAQLEESLKKLSGSDESSQYLKSQIENLIQEIKQCKEEKQKIESEAIQTIQTLRNQVKDLKAVASDLEETQNSLKETQIVAHSLEEKLKTTEIELQTLSNISSTDKNTIYQLQLELNALKEESNERQNLSNQRISSIQTELENTLNQLKDSQGTSTQLQSQVNLLQAELNTLKQEKSKVEEEAILKVKSLVTQLKELKSVKVTLEETQEELRETQLKVQTLEEDLNQTSLECEKLKAEIQTLNQVNGTLKNQFSHSQQEITQKQKEIQSRDEIIQSKLLELKRTQELIQKKEELLVTSQNQIHLLEEQIKNYQKEIEEQEHLAQKLFLLEEEMEQLRVNSSEQADLREEIQLKYDDLAERYEEIEVQHQLLNSELMREKEKSRLFEEENSKTVPTKGSKDNAKSKIPSTRKPISKIPKQTSVPSIVTETSNDESDLVRGLQEENKELKKKVQELQAKLDRLLNSNKDTVSHTPSISQEPPKLSPQKSSEEGSDGESSNTLVEEFGSERKRSSSATASMDPKRPPSRSSDNSANKPTLVRRTSVKNNLKPVPANPSEEGLILQHRLEQMIADLIEYEKDNKNLAERITKFTTSTKFEENEESKKRQEEFFLQWDQEQEEHCKKLDELKEGFEEVYSGALTENTTITGKAKRASARVDLLKRNLHRVRDSFKIAQKLKRRAAYTPVGDDSIESLLAEVITATGFSVPLKRISEGVYMLGVDRRIHLKVISGYLVIRVGGGFMKFAEWIEKQGVKEGLVINPEPIKGIGAHIKTSSGIVTKSLDNNNK